MSVVADAAADFAAVDAAAVAEFVAAAGFTWVMPPAAVELGAAVAAELVAAENEKNGSRPPVGGSQRRSNGLRSTRYEIESNRQNSTQHGSMKCGS